MPRLFYKVLVGVFFTILVIALLGAEALFVNWLAGKYPDKAAWVAYVILGLVDIPIMMALVSSGAKRVREA